MSQQSEKAADRKTGKNKFLRTMKYAVLFLLISGFAVLMVCLNLSASSADVTCDCGSCHGSAPHGSDWMGCSGCHDTPPQTGTHLVHYGSAPVVTMGYGDTGVSSTVDAYKFGCGNCHPLDPVKHNNGTVDVELYDASAPVGSLKAKNPSNAAYVSGSTVSTYPSKMSGGRSLSFSNGECSNIYCHSGYTVTSGPVGYPTGTEQYGNLTYPPYDVTYSRVYKTTPAWGTTGTFTTCTECHAFPLTTSDPSVQSSVGDSHQWIDDLGYGNLHAYNMGDDPISCRTCHYGTVTQANTWSQTAMFFVTTYTAVPLASHELHVNGTPDVHFDTVSPENPVTWGVGPGLSGASYDPVTKSCSNVACHMKQTYVIWGTPYKYEKPWCNICHTHR